MKKIQLEVIGLSYSQSQSGAYALIIGEVGGKRRIPIIIGFSEAQAIALELENFRTKRPLTHDLFYNFSQEFNISLTEVLINDFNQGVFYSLLVFKQNDTIIQLDSRTSDAIALALRFKCKIFTFQNILDVSGIILDEIDEETKIEEDINISQDFENAESEYISIISLSDNELKELLEKSIQVEDYEKASLIRDELKRRTKKS